MNQSNNYVPSSLLITSNNNGGAASGANNSTSGPSGNQMIQTNGNHGAQPGNQIYMTFQTGSQKNLKRQVTMPLSGQNSGNTSQNSQFAGATHNLNGRAIIHVSEKQSSTQIHQDPSRQANKINGSNGQQSQVVNQTGHHHGNLSSHGNPGSQGTGGGFLPDIYMTTAANGKVPTVSTTKQPSSQSEAAKRLIQKTKQFILIEENHNGNGAVQPRVGGSYKRGYQEEDQITVGSTAPGNISYFNFKDTPQPTSNKYGVPSVADIQEENQQQFVYKSPGFQHIVKQKNTPKTKSLTEQKQPQKAPPLNQKIDAVIGVTNARSPHGTSVDNYYNKIISPKQQSSIQLNQVVASLQIASPMQQSQIYLHNPLSSKMSNGGCSDQAPGTPSMSSNHYYNQQNNIISNTGKLIAQGKKTCGEILSASVNAYQTPQIKPNKQVWKSSIDDCQALLDNPIFTQGGGGSSFQATNQNQLGMTHQILQKMPTSIGSQSNQYSRGNPNAPDDMPMKLQRTAFDDQKESLPLRNKGAGSVPPSQSQKQQENNLKIGGKIVVSKQSTKQTKIAYKQMRESSDKGKAISGNHQNTFLSMDNNNSQMAVKDSLQFSVLQAKTDDLIPLRSFKTKINYEQYMKPKTDKVYEFQSKRVEFRRRHQNKNSQVVIIHFDGVIGEIMQKNLADDHYQIYLRHGTKDGLLELSRNFQLVIFSMYNERYCGQIIDLFDKEGIVFDGFYQRLKAFKRTDEYCNYNQIYLDFEISQIEEQTQRSESQDDVSRCFSSCEPALGNTLEQKSCVQNSALIVTSICMENDDIKDKEGDSLLYQEKNISSMQSSYRNLSFKGLPIDSLRTEQPPVVFLVPHVRSQIGNLSVSLINISNIITSLLVTSCLVKEDQLRDLKQESSKDRDQHLRALREEERIKQQLQLQMNSNSRSPSPKRHGVGQVKTQSTIQQKGGFFMMTITTISPKNHFKKILASTKDKVLDQKTCNWLQAFYQIKKYKLFSLKTASSIKFIPENLNKRREDDILKLKQTVYKLKALLKSHNDSLNPTQSQVKDLSNQKAQQVMNELQSTNDWAKQSCQQYKNDYYKNLVQILSNHQNTSLPDLIKELEDRISEIETSQQYFFLGGETTMGLTNQNQGDQSLSYNSNPLSLFRFFILQGHQFQNYPLESKAIIKERDTTLQLNLFNWVVKKSSRNTGTKKALTNPLNLLNGQSNTANQNYNQGGFGSSDNQNHQFLPGYRIFSDCYP